MPQSCPFCTFDRIKHVTVYEDEVCRVFSSNPRLMFGHTLVVPRRHVEAIYSLPEAEWIRLLKVVFLYQQKLIAGYARRSRLKLTSAGCDVSWHTRPFMPTTELTIPGHAHVHLRPRLWKDEYYELVSIHETTTFSQMDQKEIEEFPSLFSD